MVLLIVDDIDACSALEGDLVIVVERFARIGFDLQTKPSTRSSKLCIWYDRYNMT